METRKSCVGLLVLVAIIIVVCIVVLIVKPAWSVPMPVERTFHVSVVQLQCHPPRTVYLVDGKVRPTLRLRRNRKYRFVLAEGCHPLYVTTSSVGGPSLPGSIASNVDARGMVAADSDLYVVTSKDMPASTMYYQSTLEEGVGGQIAID
jgi:hypothetical protein